MAAKKPADRVLPLETGNGCDHGLGARGELGGGDLAAHHGFLSHKVGKIAGTAIHEGNYTQDEALAKCAELPGCIGWSFHGDKNMRGKPLAYFHNQLDQINAFQASKVMAQEVECQRRQVALFPNDKEPRSLEECAARALSTCPGDHRFMHSEKNGGGPPFNCHCCADATLKPNKDWTVYMAKKDSNTWHTLLIQRTADNDCSDECVKVVPLSEGGPDPYCVLQVKIGAGEGEIKQQFRKLSQKHHPDKVSSSGNAKKIQEAQAKFIQIKNAYDLLTDPSLSKDLNQLKRKLEHKGGAQSLYQGANDIVHLNTNLWKSVGRRPAAGKEDVPWLVYFYTDKVCREETRDAKLREHMSSDSCVFTFEAAFKRASGKAQGVKMGALNCKRFGRLCKKYMVSDHVAAWLPDEDVVEPYEGTASADKILSFAQLWQQPKTKEVTLLARDKPCECSSLVAFTSDDVRSPALLGALRRSGLNMPVVQVDCTQGCPELGDKPNLPNFGVCAAGGLVGAAPPAVPSLTKLSPEVRNAALAAMGQVAALIPPCKQAAVEL